MMAGFDNATTADYWCPRFRIISGHRMYCTEKAGHAGRYHTHVDSAGRTLLNWQAR